ncbi:MAG: hexosaminidase [Roseivirga sp.]|jgi:hexosaminidase
MKNLLLAACFVLLMTAISCQSDQHKDLEVTQLAIVPQPQSIAYGEESTVISSGVALVVSEEGPEATAQFLSDYLETMGWESSIVDEAPKANFIDFRWKKMESSAEGAYDLIVSKQGIEIGSATNQGLFYGVQSLIQMLPLEGNAVRLPVMEIQDTPRFSYRGMHLDVGRHFFPVDFIKKYLDMMALYKMNTFHWHLTEDQGWRIEIKKYPRLTEIGSIRKETMVEKNFDPYVGDGEPYGGFYTQEQIKEIVAYATERHITVIPEIEMPGHSVAALAAYPELGCSSGPFEVATKWGVADDIYCPSEATFTFLENVLTEVIDLFPGKYIHIGGDEAPKGAWEKSALAQQVIKREGLKDEFELQSYFIRRIEKFLLSKNRQLIGWDEILEGGLAPEATVMSWRGEAGGIEAAEDGHDVIMTPNDICYFDHYQADSATEPLAIGGFTTLEDVYAYEPVPKELSADKAHHVLGAQGNVWTEYMKTTDYVEYMVFPRMLALSETVWTHADKKDWSQFQKKMETQYKILEARSINAFRPKE